MNLSKNLSKAEQDKLDQDFYSAIFDENFTLAKQLLDDGADIEKENVRGESLLFLFAMKERPRAMDWLVQNGADINSENLYQDTILSNAILNKKWFLTEWALKNKSDLNRENKIGATPLIQCINSQNFEIFEKLLAAGADPDYITSTKNNALVVACSKNCQEFIKKLLEVAKNFDVKDDRNNNLLHLIALHGRDNFEKINDPNKKKDPKAKAKAKNQDPMAELNDMLDALNGSKEAHANFEAILQKSSKLLHEKNIYNETPLSLASETSQIEIMKTALKNKADPNVPFAGRMSSSLYPLHIALLYTPPPTKEEVMQAIQAQMGGQGQGGGFFGSLFPNQKPAPNTPPPPNPKLELVEMLIANNANVNAKSDDEVPAAVYAGLGNNSVEVLEKLKQAGMNFNEKDKNNSTIIHAYLTRNNTKTNYEAIEFVLKNGVNPNVTATIPADGFKILATPLDLAVLNRDEQAVEMLLKYKADPSTALSYLQSKDIKQYGEAIKQFQIYGNVQKTSEEEVQKKVDEMAGKEKEAIYGVIDKLLSHGADINVKDKDGDTPLYTAIEKKDYLVVDALLEKGADPYVKNKEGISPILKALMEDPEVWQKLYEKEKNNLTLKYPDIILDATFNSPPASRRRMLDNIKMIEDKTLFEVKNEDGNNPLIVAAATTQDDLVEIFIEKKVSINEVNHCKENALFHAVAQNAPYIVTLLLNGGADYKMKLADGTELKTFANYNSSASTSKALLQGIRNIENPPKVEGGSEEVSATEAKKTKMGP